MKTMETLPAAVADGAALLRLIRARRTTRAFRPDPIPRWILEDALQVAGRAPSSFNTQPWRVHVLLGEAKERLSELLGQAFATGACPPFSPFPDIAPARQSTLQQEFGTLYYGALGIDRTDANARANQTARNFQFFGAPVGLIFTIDAALTRHSWLDHGIFLQTVMLAAHAYGLATCPQVSFVRFQPIIVKVLHLAPNEVVTCAMSLGYPDERAPVNHIAMPREPLQRITTWHQART
jgi:nitroreductase